MPSHPTQRPRLTGPAACVTTLLCAALAWPAWAAERVDPVAEACLECHAEEGDTLAFADGSERSVFVDGDALRGSVHGARLTCTDCHRGYGDPPHPDHGAASTRAYTLAQATSCKRCHYAYYTRVLDSSHYRLLEDGRQDAPTCVDCHGAHDTRDPKAPRSALDQSCGGCHEALYAEYRGSVHGQALAADNPDVPGCVDCHGAHTIADPKAPGFHAASHELCARCHGDAERMRKYGLSAGVLTSYLEDFHGASNRLYAQGAGTPDQPIATCTDCHGIHGIQKQSREQSRAEARQRVVQTCRKCHEGVPDGFADAWLSHHEPTLASAPLVWGVRLGYRVLIPFILLGLVTHILLHLWRVRTHR